MMQKWYEKTSTDSDVVISCSVRLARNIKGFLFSRQMSASCAEELVDKVLTQSDKLEQIVKQKVYKYKVNCLKELDKASMVEWRVISQGLAQKDKATGLLITEDEEVSIMVNEEDHLRIQVMKEGMNLSSALDKANEIDDYFSEQCGYAYDPHYGYLTSCPTNVGTGLKASYFLFLPALGMAGKIDQFAEEINKYGVQIRNIFGEANRSFGHIYQIFNKTTLGRSESEIIDNLEQVATQIILEERKRREYILSVNSDEIEDKIYRSYGVLKYAKKLSTGDSLLMLSQLKFGLDAKMIRFQSDINIIKIMMAVAPASLQKIALKQMSRNERDRYRAAYLNKILPAIAQDE